MKLTIETNCKNLVDIEYTLLRQFFFRLLIQKECVVNANCKMLENANDYCWEMEIGIFGIYFRVSDYSRS